MGSAAITLAGVSLAVFLAIHLLPGSFEQVMVPRGPESLRQQIAEKFGLDQPLPIQFFRWIGAAASGDLGVSLVTQEPIADAFALRVPATLELASLAVLIAVVLGVPIGLWSGLNHARPAVSATGRIFGNLMMSVPDFVVASIFLYIFSSASLGLTVGQWVDFSVDPVAHLQAVVLPAVTLAALGIGLVVSTTRTAVIGVLAQDFIAAAIAAGKSPRTIVRHHILRNISIALITALTIYGGYLVGGAIIVEMLYSVPGLGRFLIQSLLNRDYPVIQGGVLVIAAAVVLLNMLADILYGVIDPRVRRR